MLCIVLCCANECIETIQKYFNCLLQTKAFPGYFPRRLPAALPGFDQHRHLEIQEYFHFVCTAGTFPENPRNKAESGLEIYTGCLLASSS